MAKHMPIQDELKKAIVKMPLKEKDKLLLRLIAKDGALSDKLYFELVEGSTTIPERREDIAGNILHSATMAMDTPGWIMMEMRSLSGEISYHVKITKDKLGSVELNLLLLNTFLDRYSDKLQNLTSRSEKCAQYIAKKALTIITALQKLNEDYRFDFVADANRMLKLVHGLCSKMYARQLGVPEEIE
jgi:hypothetical protein